MFRRRKPPEPPPSPNRHDQLAELAMTWRGTAADLNVSSLRLGTPAARRALNTAAADAWMTAARQLEQALKEEEP